MPSLEGNFRDEFLLRDRRCFWHKTRLETSVENSNVQLLGASNGLVYCLEVGKSTHHKNNTNIFKQLNFENIPRSDIHLLNPAALQGALPVRCFDCGDASQSTPQRQQLREQARPQPRQPQSTMPRNKVTLSTQKKRACHTPQAC